jgi:UDP-N-acetylmuramate--alanine ligase
MGDRVVYFEEPEDSIDELKELLRPGDLFVTMGAGDNFKLVQKMFAFFSEKEQWVGQ